MNETNIGLVLILRWLVMMDAQVAGVVEDGKNGCRCGICYVDTLTSFTTIIAAAACLSWPRWLV